MSLKAFGSPLASHAQVLSARRLGVSYLPNIHCGPNFKDKEKNLALKERFTFRIC